MVARALVLLECVVLLAACGIPRDPEGTLQRVTGDTLHVGYVENPPWVVTEGNEPSGVEVELVRAFARELSAEIAWTSSNYADLVTALEQFEIDMMVGGLISSVPGAQRVALTAPYHVTRHVVALPIGAPQVEELTGMRVAVATDNLITRHHLNRQGATAVPMRDLAQAEGAVAAPYWKVSRLGYQATDIVLYREHHVLAVPPGENDFLMRLETFLSRRRDAVEAMLDGSVQ